MSHHPRGRERHVEVKLRKRPQHDAHRHHRRYLQCLHRLDGDPGQSDGATHHLPSGGRTSASFVLGLPVCDRPAVLLHLAYAYTDAPSTRAGLGGVAARACQALRTGVRRAAF